MNLRVLRPLAVAVALFSLVDPCARAAEPPAGGVVELPPMLIEESAKLPPWLYVQSEDTEYLSRCSERTTRDYVEMRRSRMEWVRALIPSEFLFRSDVAGITILTSQSQKSSAHAEVIGQLVAQGKQRASERGYVRATFAPDMMLNDADIVGVFAHIDEANFNRHNLTIASDNVAFLLNRRTPALPLWLREGLLAVYNDILFDESPVTLRPLVWQNPAETARLASNPSAARALLPIAELFSNTRRPTAHAELAHSQRALLVRWALDPRHGQREAFWRFVARASEEAVTEPVFFACFGFGYSDLRDRLSDYLPLAIRAPLQLSLPRAPTGPTLKIRPATPSEIARLRGEWERLSIPLVRARFPAAAPRYLEQAQRTLSRAYDDGDRDPRLLATLGLCQLDAGFAPAARPLLEGAVAAGVVRPRAYHEVARLKWRDLLAAQPTVEHFTEVEVAEVLALLRRGLAQAPAQADTFDLFAHLWNRAAVAPTDVELYHLRRTTSLFTADSPRCLRIAAALARHGKRSAAIAVLGAGFPYARDDATRKQFAQAYAALEPAH